MLSAAEEIEYLELLEADIAYEAAMRWAAGDLRYKLHEAQRLIYDVFRSLPPEVRDVVLLCARRFGKSFLIVVLAIEDCLRNPGVIVRIVGPEIEQTLEIVEFNLNKIVADAPRGFVRAQGSKRRWRVGESLIIIGAFDAKNVRRNLGKEAFAIYTEEAGNAKSEDFDYGMREVLSPQVLHNKGRLVHATTPPPELDHVFETQYIPRAKLAGTLFKFTVNDNPLLDDAQRQQAIDDSGGIHTVAYKRNYLVQSVKDPSKVVLPSFDTEKHVGPWVRPLHATWAMFGDAGGVQDHTWFCVAYYDFEKATLVVVDESHHLPNTSSAVIAAEMYRLARLIPERVRAKWKANHEPIPFHYDCPGQTRIDLRDTHGIETTPPAKDDFEAAINALDLAFRKNRVRLPAECKQAVATCEFGRFNKNRTDFLRTPELGHCDAIAGLIYGWRMIDKITNPYPDPQYDRDHWHVPDAPSEGQSALGDMFKRF